MYRTLEEYLHLPYRLEIIPDEEEGGYGARYPELPGCITCAQSLEQLLVHAQDAKREWLTAAMESSVVVPLPEYI